MGQYSKKQQWNPSLSEVNQIILFWDKNTFKDLMGKFYHIAAVELAWSGGDGSSTNRIEYNPVFSKICQDSSKICTNSKWLITNSESQNCPVRLFHKLISKWGEHITSPRLFLKPNQHWKTETDRWYDNVPVERNAINGWTESSAEVTGVSLTNKNITNHSNRSTAVSELTKNCVQEQQLLKITGHNNSHSIKRYLYFDQEHLLS